MKVALWALPFALALPASAQTALIREGDPAPSGIPGQIVEFIGNTNVNESGGFAARLTIDDQGATINQIWGTFDGTAPTILRTESTFGTLEQVNIESFFGISSGTVVYSAAFQDPIGAMTMDSIWVDDTMIAVQDTQAPGSASYILNTERPDVTENGLPYFVSNTSTTLSGTTQGRALLFGASPTTLIETGDLLPNLPFVLDSLAVSTDYRFSALGTHYIIEVDLDTQSAMDAAMTIDGAGLMLGGTLVQESVAIPTSVGGNGAENWDNFDFVGITDTGEYFFTGDTDGDSSNDEFIVRNGVIWAREGDTLDGEVLTGSIESASINEAGEIAFIWDVVEGAGDVEALFREDTLLLKEGDEVDWDGDGVLDAGVVVTNFTGISTMTIGGDGSVYFTADVDANGSTLEGFFVFGPDGAGTNFCMANPNVSGGPAVMSSTGSASIADNNLVLTCSGMPTSVFAFFIVSETQGFVANPGGSFGNLCLSGSIGRTVGGSILNTGPSGSASANVDWTALPQPSGTVAAMAGETWNFQCWMRDMNSMGLAGSNFSDGYAVIVE